jgi:hypothetical protein
MITAQLSDAWYYLPASFLNWMILLRSRLEGRPSGAGLNAIPARRSAATLARNSRLASVSR